MIDGMTAQIADRVRYDGLDYSIAGVAGAGLFDPKQVGWTPVATSSACWRGFHCGYLVERDQLLLDRVTVGLGEVEREPPPTLFGHRPTKERIFGGGIEYQGLSHPVPYDGGLLLGSGFLQEYYVHMGFHPAWKFERVQELIFEAGRLIHSADMSGEMATFRAKVDTGEIKPDESGSLETWIEKTFTLGYGRSRTVH